MQDCVLELNCGQEVDLLYYNGKWTVKFKTQLRFVGRENLGERGQVQIVGQEYLQPLEEQIIETITRTVRDNTPKVEEPKKSAEKDSKDQKKQASDQGAKKQPKASPITPGTFTVGNSRPNSPSAAPSFVPFTQAGSHTGGSQMTSDQMFGRQAQRNAPSLFDPLAQSSNSHSQSRATTRPNPRRHNPKEKGGKTRV